MNGLITGVEQAFTAKGAEYKKVTVLDDKGKTTTKNVFDNLSEKWPLLEENKYREFKMEKRGQFWNVIDVLEVDMPEAQPPDKVLPEHQKIISEEVKGKPAPQELGMWFKHKAFSLSYAKDLACHGVIERNEIYKVAEEMLDWLNKPMV